MAKVKTDSEHVPQELVIDVVVILHLLRLDEGPQETRAAVGGGLLQVGVAALDVLTEQLRRPVGGAEVIERSVDIVGQVAFRLAEVPITTHDFRHAKATVMLNEGAKLSEVQDILGHASPETTKKIYAHYEVGHLRQAFDRYSLSAEEMAERRRWGGKRASRGMVEGPVFLLESAAGDADSAIGVHQVKQRIERSRAEPRVGVQHEYIFSRRLAQDSIVPCAEADVLLELDQPHVRELTTDDIRSPVPGGVVDDRDSKSVGRGVITQRLEARTQHLSAAVRHDHDFEHRIPR